MSRRPLRAAWHRATFWAMTLVLLGLWGSGALLWALPSRATEMAADDPNANASFNTATTAEVVDCETLAIAAGRAEGLPEGLLPAIARVESGRGTGDGGRRAWPWTLNEAGDGSFYAAKADAMARLTSVVDTGSTNIDVGCMQLN